LPEKCVSWWVIRLLELVPVDAYINETEHVAHEDETQRQQRAEIRAVRDFEFQHHDGDDDGDDAVTEGFEAILSRTFILRS